MPTAQEIKARTTWNKGLKKKTPCVVCGVDVNYSPSGRPLATCSKECLHNLRSQKAKNNNPPSRLGKRVNGATHESVSLNGYVVHREGDGKHKVEYYIHRKMMEDFLGRKLSRNEVVHHIDGIKTNNVMNNLLLMTNSEHSRLHMEVRNGNAC